MSKLQVQSIICLFETFSKSSNPELTNSRLSNFKLPDIDFANNLLSHFSSTTTVVVGNCYIYKCIFSIILNSSVLERNKTVQILQLYLSFNVEMQSYVKYAIINVAVFTVKTKCFLY